MTNAQSYLYIKEIALTQFKNYAQCRVQLNKGVSLIAGENGAGKTNLLDAVYYLCCCKSYFQTSESANIQHEKDFFRLDGIFEQTQDNASEVNLENITVKCTPRKKEISRNGRIYDKLSAHVGLLPLIIITPDDTELIKGGSEERRKLMDLTLSQLDSDYLQALIRYNKIVQQRNALLKQFAETAYFDATLLEAYDAQLIAPAQLLYQKRKLMTEEILPFLQQYYHQLSNGRETVAYTYKSALHQTPYAAILTQRRLNDREAQRTTEGIHRDDWVFDINGYALKKFGSQGQQKSFLIALKLALYCLLHQHKGVTPLLLLDDVFDKLDPQRIAGLTRIITQAPFGQVLMTDTQSERMSSTLQASNIPFDIISVANGKTVP